jgi:hypothetical protein
MTPADSRKPDRRVHSINFDPETDAWIESIAERLLAFGYPKAGRSAIVREALQDLQQKLAGHSDAELLRFFIERETARLFVVADRKRGAPNTEEQA